MTLKILYLVFVIAMLVDASRRQPHWSWYLVILLLGPVGPFVYLALVALPAWSRKPHFGNGTDPRAPLAYRGTKGEIETLRARLEQLRTTENLVELAEALLARREVPEAAALAEEAHAGDATNRRAVFVLGASRLAFGDFAGCERALTPLVSAEPGYRDHEARLLLCEALWHLDRREEALGALRDLAQRSRALPHRVTLAKFLERGGACREARNELESALAEHSQAPDHVKRRLRDDARSAEQRLTALRREA